ncbi:MAG: hypothetical protein GX927_09110 [Lentisphaerae bacterium]|jgi:LmbE family N-acetylglucosaminyl deacetylase|nr:hypothetical protein [Lentisphaerota bacterium]
MRILIFCAHADDEVIGMGGSIRLFAMAGAQIRLVTFSEGAEGYALQEERDSIVATRHAEIGKVCEILGIQEYFNLHGLDWDLRVGNAGYRAVIHHIREFRPDAIFTHGCRDYNDHQAVSKTVTEAWFHASLACAMEAAPVFPMSPLYEFEVIETMPEPGVVVDITEVFEVKLEAMEVYGSQSGIVGGAAQMITGRALLRGQMIGVKYGEAFRRSSYRPKAVANIQDLLKF